MSNEKQPANKEGLSNENKQPSEHATTKQEKSDPQLTELRGFVDPSEDIEPTLTDGTKSPEKAGEENTKQP